MRVAIGPSDPAGVGSALAAGLRSRGHDVQVVTWVASPWGYPSNEVVGARLGAAAFALRAPGRFDALHVMGGRSWFAYADVALARLRRRPVTVVQYNGSDCRTSDVAAALHPARARIVDPARDREIALHRRIAGRLAQAAVVQDLELVDYLRGAFERIYVAPFAIDMAAVERAEPAHESTGDGPLKVLHAPSNRFVKGSDAIEAAVRAAGVELVTVTGSHEEVLDEIARADVVVDQLNAETPGVLSAEAMALGKPVLCEYVESKLAGFARPCPVVTATAETLRDRLLELAADPERRARLGLAGREYARSVHAPERAAAAAEAVYGHAASAPAGVYEVGPTGEVVTAR